MLGEELNELRFYNGLDEFINNEMFSISNIKIEQLPFYVASVDNYYNKCSGLTGFKNNNILATDQVQMLVLSDKNILKKELNNLLKG